MLVRKDRFSTGIKRVFSKKQEKELIDAMENLLNKVIAQINQKLKIKNKKVDTLYKNIIDSDVNQKVKIEVEQRYKDEKYILIIKKMN